MFVFLSYHIPSSSYPPFLRHWNGIKPDVSGVTPPL